MYFPVKCKQELVQDFELDNLESELEDFFTELGYLSVELLESFARVNTGFEAVFTHILQIIQKIFYCNAY